MAETITLRAYLDDVNNLLERGAATEAISHCRYILQHYPRNIETYRLLAQALLQKAQDQGIDPLFSEAAEVFLRVLGVMPNDYVAHLGLSEIREQENQLDQSIWHMERAYEQIPGNQMLQAALRELYAKRDGKDRAPEKIHLTRGALARQYITGQLYDQALIEMRHALEQNPSRLDLQVMLAETLWESHHPIEAGEVALQILKKLPDCLPANRILARLWLDNERPTDAQFFLDRLEALNPYAAAEVLQPDTHVPDPHLLTRLDYSTEAQASLAQSTPDWIQDLGDLDGVDVGSVFQIPAATPPAAQEKVDSLDWAGSASEPADQGVPDWFAAIGQDTSSEPEQPSALDADWLGEPAGPSDANPPDWFAELGEPADQVPVEADWLTGIDDIGDSSALFGETAVPDQEANWLANVDSLEEEQPSFEAQAEALSWEEAGISEPDEAASHLEWLEDDTLVPESPSEESSLPPMMEEDWLAGFDAVESPFNGMEEQTPSDLDWLAEEPVSPPAETLDELRAQAEPLEEVDWPAETEADALFSEAIDDTAAPDAQTSSGFTDLLAGIDSGHKTVDQAADADDVEITPPEWLAAFSEEEAILDQEVGTLWSSEIEAETPDQGIAADAADDEGWSWEEAEALAEDEIVAGSDSDDFSLEFVEEAPTAEAHEEEETDVSLEWTALPQENIPDWLTEPESDFFALASAPPQDEAPAVETLAADADDWFSEVEPVSDSDMMDLAGEMADAISADVLPSAAIEDEADWIIEEEDLTVETDFMRAEPGAQDIVADEQPAEERSELFEMADESFPRSETIEEETADSADWIQPAAGAQFDLSAPAAGEVLDWLQPQAAQDDWLGSFAKTGAEEAAPDTFEPGEAPSFVSEEETWVEPDLDFEADAGMELAPDAEFGAMFDTEAPVAEMESAQLADVGEEYDSVDMDQEAETGLAAGDVPAWMAGLEPVELEEAPTGQEGSLFEQPYDPFEGGSADKVPEYQSAKETGILQPDESPDWMKAFGDEEVLIELEEEADIEIDLGDDESFLSALGIEPGKEYEIEAEAGAETSEPELDVATDGLTSPDTGDFASDTAALAEPSSAEEEGAMPAWLEAITSSAAAKFDDLQFEEPESYSSSAEASGLVPESEMDWLTPFGEEIEEEQSSEAFELELEDLEPGEEVAADIGFQTGFAEAEMDVPPTTADRFDFDLPEMEVAQPGDLAHTKELEIEEDETPWTDDESIPEDFSFEEIVPRWLRRPKESYQETSSHQHDQTTSDQPDWLRDVFEDDESDDRPE